MILNNYELLPFIIIFLLIYLFFSFKQRKNYFEWVKSHWFHIESRSSKISMYLLSLSLILFSMALLDLRGPEQKITGKTSDQRTIILIDSSGSMLAEDVRPNRYNKALLLVRHYVKKAIGQKVAVNVFSDGQKTIVPFTDDYDLIKARVGMLETLELKRGGTGLSLAIQESIQYFKNTSEDVIGNILIFTDAEETDGGIELTIPDGISVAVVGVGTAKGSTIPVRDRKNVFQGNKKHQGKVVITKLNEDFLKSLGDKIENYKYWIVSSYSLPTEEIINFFNRSFELKTSKNEFRIRPILASYFLVPAMILFILAMLLDFKKSFVTLMLLISFNISAQNSESNEEEPEKVKSEKTLSFEKKFREGELDDSGIGNLASSLLQDKFSEEAELLYKETLPKDLESSNLREHFNYATSMLMNEKPSRAISKYNNILDYMKGNTHEDQMLEDEIKKNILKALKQSAGGKGKKGQDKEKSEERDENKDSESEKGNSEGKPEDDKNNEDDKKENKDKDDGDKNKKPSDKDTEEKNKDKKNKSESGKEKKERKKKVPVLLKQLMSDDNQLQKKLIDAKTIDNRKSSKAKDW